MRKPASVVKLGCSRRFEERWATAGVLKKRIVLLAGAQCGSTPRSDFQSVLSSIHVGV
jgi:hypothetical protein